MTPTPIDRLRQNHERHRNVRLASARGFETGDWTEYDRLRSEELQEIFKGEMDGSSGEGTSSGAINRDGVNSEGDEGV